MTPERRAGRCLSTTAIVSAIRCAGRCTRRIRHYGSKPKRIAGGRRVSLQWPGFVLPTRGSISASCPSDGPLQSSLLISPVVGWSDNLLDTSGAKRTCRLQEKPSTCGDAICGVSTCEGSLPMDWTLVTVTFVSRIFGVSIFAKRGLRAPVSMGRKFQARTSLPS
jgi:hypothetical protein